MKSFIRKSVVAMMVVALGIMGLASSVSFAKGSSTRYVDELGFGLTVSDDYTEIQNESVAYAVGLNGELTGVFRNELDTNVISKTDNLEDLSEEELQEVINLRGTYIYDQGFKITSDPISEVKTINGTIFIINTYDGSGYVENS